LTGVIREASYENPHSLIKLQVDEGKGKTWLAYLAPPSRMDSRGFQKDMLKVGATATLVGYPHKTTADEMRGRAHYYRRENHRTPLIVFNPWAN